MGLVIKVAAGVVLGLCLFSVLIAIGNEVYLEATAGPVRQQRAACVRPDWIWSDATRQCFNGRGPIDALTGLPLSSRP